MLFSTKNFQRYYTAYARIYGLFLFCCYFELFDRFLHPEKNISAIVDEIRFSLLSKMRWPELITLEELGLPRPEGDLGQYIYRFVDAHLRKRSLLKIPDKATTMQHVERLVRDAQNDPEALEKLRREFKRIEGTE